MPPSKIRFVTACQQLLALGLVVAVLTPAASVVSLDVVHDRPSGSAGTSGLSADLSAYVRESARASTVPAEVVDPTVKEFALTPASVVAGSARLARTKSDLVAADSTVTSVAEPVEGYGAVGVTWAHGTKIPEGDIALQVRTRTGQAWSDWLDLAYDSDHGPDPGSEEARHARPGTDALLVGDVDDVQVQVTTTDGDLPPDLRLAVVDPGQADKTAVELPALDTDGDIPSGTPSDPGTLQTDPGAGDDGSDEIALKAATYTPRPQIYSRAQWGADESMRDKSSLHYFEVHAGFVHHTVNANDYSRAEVPAIIRSIYAYHTESRGWSDIGYNFLVDRFGRIWEGRYGGIDRPVVGAHTLNYNDYAFAMSAIGNYDIKQPSNAMVEAYGALFAWKLSLHGVDASSTRQWVGSKYFEAINGHRDAAATACPGKYLYAQIPRIRQLAAEAQRGWAGRELESNIAGNDYPDLVVRRSSDKQVFVVPTAGLTSFSGDRTAAQDVASSQLVVVSPDLNGDGRSDLLVRSADGTTRLRPGNAGGRFNAPLPIVYAGLAAHSLITAVGDINGDRRNDLVARSNTTGRLDVFLGRGNGTFALRQRPLDVRGYDLLAATGDLTGDGRPDLVARDDAGKLWLVKGGMGARFAAPKAMPGSWGGFSTIRGFGDMTGDGTPDLFLRNRASGNGYVLPGRGDGTFQHARGPLPGITTAGSIVGAAQIVGSAQSDVVVRQRSGGTLSVRTNAGTTETSQKIASGLRIPNANLLLNAGDWNRDGFGDILVRTTTGVLKVWLGNGRGQFPGRAIVLGRGFSSVRLLAVVGDMTGDGWPDLMGQPAGGAIRIYPGAGTSGLRASYVAHGAIAAGRQVAVGRWDGDGAPDSLFVNKGRVSLYPGNGPGGLTSGRSVSADLTPYDWVVGVSDTRLVGHADVIVRDRSGSLWVLPGSSSGGFGPRQFLTTGMEGFDLAG